MTKTNAPFLVITLRRTGGTSLMRFMSRISEFETVEHEPFNVDRIWGSTTSNFIRSRDSDGLRKSIREILSSTPNIKHCVETNPLEVTRELIEACHDLGYTFFVLTRRSEVDRIMSLMLAIATDVWGGEEAARIYPQIISGELEVGAVSVDDAVRQTQRDSSRLGETLKLLRHRNIRHHWLLFEEIYKGEIPIGAHAREIARLLGCEIADNDPRLLELGGETGQHSHRIEEKIPNANAVRQRLEKICIE